MKCRKPYKLKLYHSKKKYKFYYMSVIIMWYNNIFYNTVICINVILTSNIDDHFIANLPNSQLLKEYLYNTFSYVYE